MEKLTEQQVVEELKNLTGWSLTENSIRKTFSTKGFPQTMGLVTAIGALCQQHDHHPDYLTMKYSSVEVSFSTHSAKGITIKDTKIAQDINKLNF
ncbi:MAG: 4a-hydroxytetrahydrobiopterin dehydratase [Ignavibacteria bacterium]|nr:4a-hydroxytetrahydrobiopterin dehydratase [Ignavibacteria bacterium]